MALGVAATSWFRPSYLKSLGHATFEWRWQADPRALRRVRVETLATEPEAVSLALCPSEYGGSPLGDLLALGALVRTRQPQTIFEFGTFKGQTTLTMALNAPETARLYTMDLGPTNRGELDDIEEWQKHFDTTNVGEHYRRSRYANRVTQLFGDSRAFDTTPYQGKMDFVYVDACHEYDYVRSDSEKAFEMLAADGIVAWHDYSTAFPGVRRYLEELALTREVFWVEGTQVVFCRGKQ